MALSIKKWLLTEALTSVIFAVGLYTLSGTRAKNRHYALLYEWRKWGRRTNPLSREGWRCGQCVFGGDGERMNRKA